MVRFFQLSIVAICIGLVELMAPASSFAEAASMPAEVHLSIPAKRPALLLPLYGSYAMLQVLDAHSTSRALDGGGAEMNPLMKGVAGNTGGLLAIKAAAGAGVILASERLYKKNRVAATLLMVSANVAASWVVQHNYRSRC